MTLLTSTFQWLKNIKHNQCRRTHEQNRFMSRFFFFFFFCESQREQCRLLILKLKFLSGELPSVWNTAVYNPLAERISLICEWKMYIVGLPYLNELQSNRQNLHLSTAPRKAALFREEWCCFTPIGSPDLIIGLYYTSNRLSIQVASFLVGKERPFIRLKAKKKKQWWEDERTLTAI